MAHHRAARRPLRASQRTAATPPATSTAGKRKATKPTAAPRLRSLLPSGPVVAGVAALAVASAGAATTAAPATLISADASSPRASDGAAAGFRINAMGGESSVSRSSLIDERSGGTVSRSSDRGDTAGEVMDGHDVDEEALAETETQAAERNAALSQLARKAETQSKKIELNAWELPLSGYRLTGRFGQSSGLWSSTHTGLDFAAPSGTPIRAVAGGTITETSYAGAYGNRTVMTLEDGTELWYCHQTSFAVSEGDTVRAGDVIGYVGSTGNSTGPHMHLEVRPGAGDPVDPYSALVEHGLQP